MIVMPVLISRIKIAMGESEISDISKDPQRSTAPGLVLQLEQPPRQHHPLLPLSPRASGSEALLRSSAMSVEVRSSTSHHPCHADKIVNAVRADENKYETNMKEIQRRNTFE